MLRMHIIAIKLKEAAYANFPASQPILPLARIEDVRSQRSVGHRVSHDAVGQPACSDHPPVVEDAGEQTYVPVGTVLGAEDDGGDPERVVRVRSQSDGL